jgi:gliding motility-associated-like protein
MRSADPFENSLKQALDHYEVPYNSADWAQLDRVLDSRKGPSWHASAGLYALLLGGSMAVATTMHLLFSEEAVQLSSTGITSDVAENEEYAVFPTSGDAVAEATGGASGASNDDLPTASITKGSAASSDDPGNNQRAAVARSVGGGATPGPVATPTPPGSSTERLIRVSPTEGCPGTSIDFALENASEDGIHLWNFGDGSFSNKAKPSHTFSKAGTYEVMLSHSALGGGNIQHEPVSDRIVIHESPEAAFSHLKRDFPNTVPSVHFENRSIGGKSYSWDFGDGSTSEAVHPDHVYKQKGNYQVILTVTNSNGCLDRTERTVRIENDYDLHAAKTFSPNSDGVEDTFIPEALKNLGAKFQFSVFDQRTGQLLYETSDVQRPWNGRIGNKGEACTQGDYVWMVEMKDGESFGGTYNGQVRLMR